MPWLDLLWKKNPVILWLDDRGLITNDTSPVVPFAGKRMAETENQEKQVSLHAHQPLDFLARFQRETREDPDFLNDRQILALTISSVFAGSDSTAIILRAIFYFLLKNRATMDRLMEEIRTPHIPKTGSYLGPQHVTYHT